MAKFNTGGNLTEEVSVGSQPFEAAGGHPASSGIQARKSEFTNQGNDSLLPRPNNLSKFRGPKPPLGVKPSFEKKTDKDPKPLYLKPTGVGQRFGTSVSSVNRDPEGKSGFLKAVGHKPFDQPKEESKPVFLRPSWKKPSLHDLSQESDLKAPGQKPIFNAPAQENEPKPVFPKLAGAKGKFTTPLQDHDLKPLYSKPAIGQKPTNTDTSHDDQSPNKGTFSQKRPAFVPPSKPKISPLKPTKEDTENKDHGIDPSNMPFPGMTLKPVTNRSTPGSALNLPKNIEEKKEEKKVDAAKNILMSKMNQDHSSPGATPPKFPKPPSKLMMGGPWNQSQEKERGDKKSTIPKRKPLPSLLTLGPAPQKPSNPPTVDLARFPQSSPANISNKGTAPYSVTTPPLPAHPASQPAPPAPYPIKPPVSSLPLRNIKIPPEPKSSRSEENYEDVNKQSNDLGNPDENQDSSGKTCEDIKTTREREKRHKEEKKRLEQEKKKQKEKEKKEQEIKKKFNLTGPIQALQAKACCDFKGGKNELSVKQGEKIAIIRIIDNPKGKWLGRTSNGTYGYIKTTAVEVNYDFLKIKTNSMSTLPSRSLENDQVVYDEVAEYGSISSLRQSGSGGMLSTQDDDIYDDFEQEEEEEEEDNGSTLQGTEKSNLCTQGILKMLKGKDDKKESIQKKSIDIESVSNEDIVFPVPPKHLGLNVGDEVYDDVNISNFPAPPTEVSLGVNLGKSKPEDLKKLKKQEKEEKKFKKKFIFDGKIRVLYTAQVVPTLTSKKCRTRYLQLKPGEFLEVIQSTDDTKVLCRNEEGKYGYVLRSCLVDNDC